MFKEDLEMILGFEGGYANDPDDPGGATNFGVTQKTYDDYRRRKNLTPQPVKDITKQEVEEIYNGYYLGCYADKIELINPSVSRQVFDFAINAGPQTAVKALQKMLGCIQDGIYGPASSAALKNETSLSGMTVVGRMYFYERVAYYTRLALRRTQSRKFLLSWISRSLVSAGEKL